MIGDGSAEFTEAIGLAVDRIQRRHGDAASQRYSMLVEDGVVKQLNVEPSGEYGVSSGDAMLERSCSKPSPPRKRSDEANRSPCLCPSRLPAFARMTATG